MVHHQSPSSATPTSSTIKPETAAAAALQSALSLSTPMNVNVSMNFNSHSVQYNPPYGTNSNSTNFSNSPYDTFYNPTGPTHYPFTNHHSSEIKSNRDPVTSKQAMLLSAANYDYKDFSKLCEFFPTSTPMNTNEKRT